MLSGPEDSNGKPVERWGMVREEEFGAGDIIKSSQRLKYHSSAVHAQNWVPRSHLVWSFITAVGCWLGFPKDDLSAS